MTTIVAGIPTNHVSDLFVRNTLLDQTESLQSQMLVTEQQLSSGQQYSVASQNPVAAMQIMSLQGMLAVNAQATTNVTTSQSYLSTTDSALSSVSKLLSQAQADATAVIGSTATDEERGAAAQQITQTIQQLMSTANEQFEGRYLFAGSNTSITPFTTSSGGAIQYNGNNESLTSFSDGNQLFDTNVTGAAAFRRSLHAGRRRGSQPDVDLQYAAERSPRRRRHRPQQHPDQRRQRPFERYRSQPREDHRRCRLPDSRQSAGRPAIASRSHRDGARHSTRPRSRPTELPGDQRRRQRHDGQRARHCRQQRHGQHPRERPEP